MKLFQRYLFLVLTILSVKIAFAQTPTWKNITPAGWSGTFLSVDWFAGNGLIAIANNGYFYKSVDTGKTWTPYTKPVASFNSITLYPDHKRAYICGSSHLYTTTDAAVSWQEIKYTGMPSNIAIFHIYIKSEDTLLASASDGVNGAKIYRSPDKGKTWTLVGTNIQGNNALGTSIYGFYFENQLHGYGLGTEIYVETIDGGSTWVVHKIYKDTFFYGILEIKNYSTVISTNTQNPPATSNAIYFKGGINKIVQAGSMLYGVYDENFFSSSDSGKTWKIKSIDANKIFNSITFLDEQTGIIVGNYLTTYRTTDGGKTWAKYIHGGAEGFNRIYCKTKNECYVTGKKGRLFHTIDGGTTWNYQDLCTSMLSEVKFPTKDTGYVSASGQIFRTIDNGNSWKQFIQNTNGDILCFPNKDTGYVGYTGAYIQKTTDAGETWNDTWQESGYGSIAFRSANEGLMSGISNNLLYTKDGGDIWQVKAKGIVASAIIPLKDNWLVVNAQSVYLCDKDINCTLKYTDTTYNLWGPIIRDSNNIIISDGKDSIITSKDAGNSWEKEYFKSKGEITFGDKNTIYSLTNIIERGVYKSQTISSNFTKTNTQTILSTISNESNEGYFASVKLINSLLDTIIINGNTFIDNGKPLLIKIPNMIQLGTDFKIVIQPIDTIGYSTVESQVFTMTGITDIDTEKILKLRVLENRIDCECANLEIFNTLGQQMQKELDLPIGIYFVRCKNQTQKVIIKP